MCARWLRWRWLALALVGLSTVAWGQQTKLEDVRISTWSGRTRVVFDLSGPVKANMFKLANPARLVIDLPETVKTGSHADSWVGKGIIKRLRSGVRAGYDLRIVLDLKTAAIKRNSFLLPPDDAHGSRLVVDLYPHGVQPPTSADNPRTTVGQQAAVKTTQASTKAEQVAAEVRRAAAESNAAAKPRTKSVTNTDKAEPQPVAYTPVAPTSKIVVAVDAGHGGYDPGAIGSHGTMEKDVTLAMARKLAAMIDQQPNMRAIMTRKRDRYVGLRERIMRSRAADADLFVSIHANSSVDDDPHGVSVFALSLDGATSEHARLLAERENAVVSIGGVSLEQKNANVASFMLDLAQSATIEASLDVGRRVLHNLDGFTTLLRTRVEQAAFVVLKSPDTPSILVETGFISNPAEERKLRTAAYQAQVARAILLGVKGYFASYRPGTMIVKGLVHVVESGETLSGIAATYHVSLGRLREENNIEGSLIRVGQKLRIPSPGLSQVAALR